MTNTQAFASKNYLEVFGQSPKAIFFAPGRVNLIGEHTDYNNGFVLPCAIEYGTYMAVGFNESKKIRVQACNMNGELSEWDINEPITKDLSQPWANYLRGVHQQFNKLDMPLSKGLNISIAGDVPRGAGLSSSASFSVVFAKAILQLNNNTLKPWQLAKLCQDAENQFVGCNCGIMDQLISVEGKTDNAILIDCQKLSSQAIPIPKDLVLMIIDSKVKRGLVDSEYNLRRIQCEAAAKAMQIPSLREASLDMLNEFERKMPIDIYRRAHHVITENIRTLATTEAFKSNDSKRLSQLMAESHISMRDYFEITVPPIDLLVSLIYDVIGTRGGVRMTGGGFGGCVVCLLPEELCQSVTNIIKDNYAEIVGFPAEIHVLRASDGARQII